MNQLNPQNVGPPKLLPMTDTQTNQQLYNNRQDPPRLYSVANQKPMPQQQQQQQQPISSYAPQITLQNSANFAPADDSTRLSMVTAKTQLSGGRLLTNLPGGAQLTAELSLGLQLPNNISTVAAINNCTPLQNDFMAESEVAVSSNTLQQTQQTGGTYVNRNTNNFIPMAYTTAQSSSGYANDTHNLLPQQTSLSLKNENLLFSQLQSSGVVQQLQQQQQQQQNPVSTAAQLRNKELEELEIKRIQLALIADIPAHQRMPVSVRSIA